MRTVTFYHKIEPAEAYLGLDPVLYQRIAPTPLKDPTLISFSADAGTLLGIDAEAAQKRDFVDFVNGSFLPEGIEPYAMCYAGHQFGFYVPRLGDGRAVNLGLLNGWHLQLKGAGVTRYSRSGDGRAVLRSSIREYLMSEAMHGLGIATTRALALIGSQEPVRRERMERGAIVLRMSPSWIRFGSFEYCYYNRKRAPDNLRALAEYTIADSFPHLAGDPDRYFKMFAEVVADTARLIAQWQAVGFNHGVMNTDNMSIASLTIDYGPYAFLDDYDLDYICNHTDVEGRYSFGNQPYVAEWNLSKLMEALAPLVDTDRTTRVLFGFRKIYQREMMGLMRAKLGLVEKLDEDKALIEDLYVLMQAQPVDYTFFFRRLSHYGGDREEMLSLVQMRKPLEAWLDRYEMRLEKERIPRHERHRMMQKTNPKYVLKNYILQEAIDAAEQGDYRLVNDLLDIAHDPFAEHPAFEAYAGPTPLRHKNLRLSCSS